MERAIQITTINVNGLKDVSKRTRLFTALRFKASDIIFVQETHCSNSTEMAKWQSEWGGRAFWSFGAARSRGVAVLLKPNLDAKVKYFHYDTDGRMLVVDIDLSGESYRLINVYAPNDHAVRREWLNSIDRWCAGNRKIILGGDFNFVENTKIDKIGGNDDYGTIGEEHMQSLKADFSLIDIYRAKHGTSVAATWTSADGSISSRLDRFYISRSLSPQTKNVKITPCADSDHCFVDMTLKIKTVGNNVMGPGFWKCNNKTLSDPDFKEDFEMLWSNLSAHENKDLNWWEECKEKFKELIIIHSSRLRRNLRVKIEKVESNLRRVQKQEFEAPGTKREELFVLKNQLTTLLDEQIAGTKIRAKAAILDNDDRPNRYFLRREKARGEKAFIKNLEINGVITDDIGMITSECDNFYSKLYTAEPIDEIAAETLLQTIDKIPKEAADLCDGKISFSECWEAIRAMDNNKTPGSDGLTKEFYFQFFNIFGLDYVNVINAAYDGGQLTPSQKTGLITLVCKDPENANELGNWRPISLLNVDYKIISKVLSQRLRKVLGKCLHIDQTCSVKGRSITDNLHLIRNVVDYCDLTNIPAAIVSLDQSKAFDRLSHQYLFKVLQAYGFSENFQNWVRLLYTDIWSSVVVNGHIGKKFKVGRSVRQGCPLSAMLFLLGAEPFAAAIRANDQFKGIRPPGGGGEELRLSNYADDINLFIRHDDAIKVALNLFEVYGRASGAKLNLTKCRGFFIGAWRSRTDAPHGFVWSNDAKIYGVHFGVNSVFRNNLMLVNKVKKCIASYSGRNLTLAGKSVIINTVICAQLWYVGQCIALPETLAKLVNKLLFNFLWGDKTECVARNTVILNRETGGLGVTHVVAKLDSLRCKHVYNFLTAPYARWHDYAAYWIGQQLGQFRPEYALNSRPHAEMPNDFYRTALTIFYLLRDMKPGFVIADLVSKKAYKTILDLISKRPVITDKFPHIDFDRTWKALNSKLLSPRPRDLCWRIAHHVLPVNSYLFHLHINRNALCPFCRWPETLTHRFFSCRAVRPLWKIVESWASAAAGFPITVSADTVVFMQKTNTGGNEDMLAILISELNYAIWTQRNRLKYEKKNPNTADIKSLFEHFVRTRILADHLRLDTDVFARLWCSGQPPLATAVGQNVVVNI
jgi:exonuclease III